MPRFLVIPKNDRYTGYDFQAIFTEAVKDPELQLISQSGASEGGFQFLDGELRTDGATSFIESDWNENSFADDDFKLHYYGDDDPFRGFCVIDCFSKINCFGKTIPLEKVVKMRAIFVKFGHLVVANCGFKMMRNGSYKVCKPGGDYYTNKVSAKAIDAIRKKWKKEYDETTMILYKKLPIELVYEIQKY